MVNENRLYVPPVRDKVGFIIAEASVIYAELGFLAQRIDMMREALHGLVGLLKDRYEVEL
jgi:hypothetical protein